MGLLKKLFLSFINLFFVFSLFAKPQFVRWVGKEDSDADLNHLIEKISRKTKLNLSLSDFILVEDRLLATSHFIMLAQTANKIPMKGNAIRIWKSKNTGDLIQMEAQVSEAPAPVTDSELLPIDSAKTSLIARQYIRTHTNDKLVQDIRWKDEWEKDSLVRSIKVKSRRGHHFLTLDLSSGKIKGYQYSEFPQDEVLPNNIPVKIFPIWEENKAGEKREKQISETLRYLSPLVARPVHNPFSKLANKVFSEDKQDPILGLTLEGQKQGYWAMSSIKRQAASLAKKIPLTLNNFSKGGVLLDGEYTTINIHPDVISNFQALPFIPGISMQFRPDWKPTAEDPNTYRMIPTSTFLGKPLFSLDEAAKRPATRDPKHNPLVYLSEGFDEIQVYWAVTRLFEALKSMGFTDPELSTRRFHAFLFDPDISMRNNAYYTDDTINFTTYSADEPNMARDNTTIWHELGHGVMDRLMGDSIRLADTGGLSEGMADFIAQLVLTDVTQGKSFLGFDEMRIMNQTGFNLTNEVHDDGEAYGGAMRDMLTAALKKWGKEGLRKITDLTLEGMRLTRNHPGLTANGWFEHLLFADELGNDPVRKSAELRAIIIQSLAQRNFNLDGSEVAKFEFKKGNDEIASGKPGSRQRPLLVKIKPTETSAHELTVSLKGSKNYSFKYPVEVRVQLKGGPIQGAIHWQEEEKQPLVYTLKTESDVAKINLTATGTCDEVNRTDGSCVDYAYVQIWNSGDAKKPVAKKRFYLQITPTK